MNKIVVFNCEKGIFSCIIKRHGLYYDLDDNYIINGVDKFRELNSREQGVELVEQLVNNEIDKMDVKFQQDPIKKALVFVIKEYADNAQFYFNFNEYQIFARKYRELLTASLNAAFDELESK